MAAAAQNVVIQFESGTFRVSGWPPPTTPPARGWSSIFAVYAGSGDVPPLLGNYAIENGALVLRPTYPIAAGVHYRAIFRSPSGGVPVEKVFDGPPLPTNRVARVEGVYPSGDTWPSNQLRLYIYFSAPMSRGGAGRYIHMLDWDGKELAGANAVFLPGEELWDPGLRRLTMTFDPGRIKRGLTSNRTIGPPITEGRRYTLVIDAAWPDARSVPMARGFRKAFRGGPAERIPPDPKRWTLAALKSGTKSPLTVEFPGPMNYPLLQRMIRVTGPQGFVAGDISIAREEMQWRFTPLQPWIAGSYQLVIDAGLEDLAGNHIGQLFDVDVFNHISEHISTNTVSLPFIIP
jgi:hypothetical protein